MQTLDRAMPSCPHCGASDTRLRLCSAMGFWRLFTAVSEALILGIALTAVLFTCCHCQKHFKGQSYE